MSGKRNTAQEQLCKKSFSIFLNVAVHFCQEQIYNFMGTALYFQLEIKRENDSKDVEEERQILTNNPASFIGLNGHKWLQGDYRRITDANLSYVDARMRDE